MIRYQNHIKIGGVSMKQMVGIIIEVPGDFKDVRLVLYEDPVLAMQDFKKYGDKYGISNITHTIVVPNKTSLGYYYFIHEPFSVGVPDSITTNVMKFNSKAAASLYEVYRMNRDIKIRSSNLLHYSLDSKWLSSAGTTDWKEDPIKEVIK